MLKSKMLFPGNRESGIIKLNNFSPIAGRRYEDYRNFDFGTDKDVVSRLSPYISKGILSESEVIQKVLSIASYKESEKFIHEVFWRVYWKGWLEMRPEVWNSYLQSLQNTKVDLTEDSILNKNHKSAINGSTGIDCFDYWVRELTEYGYLHNHVRMWFASIWIFTLQLPWQLGAEFFYSNLLDADPASNTLSWRWVAGLQTRGKHYVATRSNIKKFTDGKFDPIGLNENPKPLSENIHFEVKEPSVQNFSLENALCDEINVLIFEDNLQSNFQNEIAPYLKRASKVCLISQEVIEECFELSLSSVVQKFSKECIIDTKNRLINFGIPEDTLIISRSLGDTLDVLAERKWIGIHPQIGFYFDFIKSKVFLDTIIDFKGVTTNLYKKSFPYCDKGFFNFKTKIPQLLEQI